MVVEIDPTSFEFGLVITILFALIVGLEREVHGKAAGVKTFITLCVGSYLLGHLSTFTTWDPMRLAVGVVTGIGFLGAGALIKDSSSGNIEGLTTAAVIWASSAISLGIGLGLRYPSMMVAAVIGLMVLLSKPISRFVERFKVHDNSDEEDV